MSKASETLGYARGLLKAMEATCEDKNLLEVMNALVDALDEHNANIRKLDEQFSELDEYVESIDDDLAELEDMIPSRTATTTMKTASSSAAQRTIRWILTTLMKTRMRTTSARCAW